MEGGRVGGRKGGREGWVRLACVHLFDLFIKGRQEEGKQGREGGRNEARRKERA
jgi:hypothetical protein